MKKLDALRTLLAKVKAGELSPRRIDAEVDAVLRIGTENMRKDAAWAYNNFPEWRAREQAGTCEVVHTGGTGGLWWESAKFSTSLDATLTLHKAVLPDFDYIIGHTNSGLTVFAQVGPESIFGTHFEDTPARAWLVAILEALITQEEELL